MYYFSHRYACLFLLDKIELGDGKKLLTPKVERGYFGIQRTYKNRCWINCRRPCCGLMDSRWRFFGWVGQFMGNAYKLVLLGQKSVDHIRVKLPPGLL